MREAVTLGRLWGIPVRVHASWLVIFGLIAWSLSVGYFPRVLPNLPQAVYWAHGLVAALLLFVSVLLHELSHSVVARRHGLAVSSITLHVFGGVSQLEQEPDRPGVEFRIAVVGPLTSLTIAVVVTLAAALLGLPPAATAVLRYLALVNMGVGLFNLAPGFPLDGGRVLRAVLWKRHGDLRRATQGASRAGVAFAMLLVGFGIMRALTGEFLGGLWFVLIGLFLRQAAETSYQQLVLRRVLAPLSVRDVMSREVISVTPDLSVGRVVEDFFWRHHVSSFPVLEGGELRGILSIHRLQDIPRERWAETRVREVMLRPAEALTAAPGDALETALGKLSRNGLGRLAVVEKGTLVGYLSLKDVFHILALSAVDTGGGLATKP